MERAGGVARVAGVWGGGGGGGGGGGAQDLGRRQRMRACGTINIYPPPPERVELIL